MKNFIEIETKEEVEILDYIINELANKSRIYARDLKPLNGKKDPISTHEDNLEGTYTPYFDILKNSGVVNVDNNLGEISITPNIKTQNFIKEGGFKAIFDKKNIEKQRNKEIDELTLRKLRWDTKISKWKVKTFWPVFIFGLIGFIFGGINFIDNRQKTKSIEELQQKQINIQSEVTKLHTLILTQKNLDSLHNSKNPVAPLNNQ